MKKYLGLVCLIPVLASANVAQTCKPESFLANGFNVSDNQKCAQFINQCPIHGPYVNEECAQKVAKNNAVCTQTAALAKQLEVSPTQIKATQQNNLTVIDVVYPADGQHHYYLTASNGCLIDTVIDPRKLHEATATEHKDKDFMITNWEAPVYKANKNGTQNFTTLLKITETCRSCPTIGWAKITYDFNKDGKWVKTHLDSFTKDQPKS